MRIIFNNEYFLLKEKLKKLDLVSNKPPLLYINKNKEIKYARTKN
jgi:hypothetical protein